MSAAHFVQPLLAVGMMAAGDAGIGDHEVDRLRGFDFGNPSGNRGLLAQIEGARNCCGARVSDCRDCGREPFRVASGQRQGDARPGIGPCQRGADAAAGAGYENAARIFHARR